MINNLLKEIDLRKQKLEGQVIETIYFGGGTPSLLSETQIAALILKVKTTFNTVKTPEITLEANPDDVTEISATAWKAAGINRLSIGIQSFDSEDLEWMNRAHSAAQGMECLPIAQKAGITNISLDLMYGLPNMDNERWLKQIHQAIALNATHISAYCLTVEEKTALHQLVARHKILPATNEQQSEQFSLLIETLKTNGYEQYEISNFSKAGFISKHNSNYWKGIHYLGIGPSAHSFDGTSRSWNIANNREYIRLIKAGKTWFETEILTKENQFNEFILTGLRTVWGINIAILNEILPITERFSKTITDYKQKGWMVEKDGQLILTESGRHWADAIAQELFV